MTAFLDWLAGYPIQVILVGALIGALIGALFGVVVL